MDRALLCIETSGPSLGVALTIESRTVFAEDIEAGSIHGIGLAPQIQKALLAHSIQARELAAIAISIGPGSWTGLRIGLSAAKAMAWALRIPLVPVPSFEALARGVFARGGIHTPVLCLRDARSEGCFAALFRETAGRPERCIEECVLSGAKVVKAAVAENISDLVLCGDVTPVNAVLAEAKSAGFNWSPVENAHAVRAQDLAACAWERFSADRPGEVLRDAPAIHAAAPMYLRRSDPELKLERRS